ncbi:hypothetical protein GH742_09070 [Legionella sp. MW5194]|uniref:hypothetical protein n=1 Tax=Legionella sp. MW5194 TaxID=2662448 RepID=UPI00193EAD14|nr:hypothetical protein [Legionella sp. MW5194]QRN04007.1 hypothetical protein GH742_09070 [Legionella sp. MW5194]
MTLLTALRPVGLKTLTFILSLFVFINSHASGGYDEERGLSGKHSPDFPLNGYVNGQLGVISPQYRLSYLIIAYRYLSNNPLSEAEQRQVLDSYAVYFSDLFFGENDFRVDVNQSNTAIAARIYQTSTTFVEKQLSHRWKESNKSPLSERVKTLIQACPTPVKPFTRFQLACQRLKAIANELETANLAEETKHAVLQAWLHAQDLLFNGESDGHAVREAINQIPVHHLPLIQLDIDYLKAVSYFNSQSEADQIKAYEHLTRLAQNKQYPWHEWAAYLSYRALTRAACQEFNSGMARPEQIQRLNDALTGMQNVTRKARDPGVSKAAKQYTRIIKGRLAPKEALLEEVQAMSHKITRAHFSDLIFYTDLLTWNSVEPLDLTAISPVTTSPRSSELVLWISHYLSTDKQKTFPLAYTHWVQSPENRAWLLVALNNISEATPSQQRTLLNAAEAVTVKQPGFFSIRSALLQALTTLEGDHRIALIKRHALIDDTLAQLKKGQDFSTRMHFAKMGIPLADSLNNLLSYGFFTPSTQMFTLYPSEPPTAHPYFSPLEFSQALNHLPLSVLIKAIDSKRLPRDAQRELAASVWARAMILQQYSVADKLALKTARLNPAMKNALLLSLKAKNPDERLKILVKTLLYFPELSPIINLKSTWIPEIGYSTVYYGIKPRKITNRNSHTYWCNHGEINRTIDDDKPRPEFSWPNLLTVLQRKQLTHEQAQLQTLPNGAVWLADKANELAKKYPNDQENAELLALAINVTRVLACYEPNAPASQRAYITLKRLYPESEGSKRTRYYY